MLFSAFLLVTIIPDNIPFFSFHSCIVLIDVPYCLPFLDAISMLIGCVRFLDGVEWNGTIPFHCHGTVPSLCSVLEWDENGMEWYYSKLD
jgi:hypothetical protein